LHRGGNEPSHVLGFPELLPPHFPTRERRLRNLCKTDCFKRTIFITSGEALWTGLRLVNWRLFFDFHYLNT